jgi:hypothetical protein
MPVYVGMDGSLTVGLTVGVDMVPGNDVTRKAHTIYQNVQVRVLLVDTMLTVCIYLCACMLSARCIQLIFWCLCSMSNTERCENFESIRTNARSVSARLKSA